MCADSILQFQDTFVGIELTSFDGDALGAVVGLAEGDWEGPFDGDREGMLLGLLEGDRLGLCVGLRCEE